MKRSQYVWILNQVGVSSTLIVLAPFAMAFVLSTSQEPNVKELDPVTEHVLLEVSKTQFARPGQQKEAFEYLWTPGLVLQQMLQETPLVAYPPE